MNWILRAYADFYEALLAPVSGGRPAGSVRRTMPSQRDF
ncbi:hypothetical protein FHS85_003057 [Rhodoligotrophos appendicifer]